jgi:protein gp37
MSQKTKIQWCDSTVNPTMGCDGCEIWGPQRKTCYAGTLHVRFGGSTPGYAPTFEDVTLYPGRMAEAAAWPDLCGKPRSDKPWLDGLPRSIFISDMSDALSAVVPFEFLRDEVMAQVSSERGRRHRWLWLTKRPDRMAKFGGWLQKQDIAWPPNLWAGTSVTSQATATRIDHLLRVGDAYTMRFLSVEPQVEPVDLTPWLSRIDWILQGGESGRGARPFDLSWADAMIAACRANGVALFIKQLGSHVTLNGDRVRFRDNHAGDWSEWPERLRVREMLVTRGETRPRGPD